MSRHSSLFFVFASILACALPSQAKLAVDKMFSDHMVLQRDLAVPIWGTATAGEKVSVAFRTQTKRTVTGENGEWMLKLDPMTPGPASALTVTGTTTIVFQDVAIGEVWVGSGQSNMAGRVRNYAKNDPLLTRWAGATYPDLRLYQGGWKIADAKTIQGFSAIHFAFGFRLHQELGIPVGLMVGAAGGTPSGRWLSPAMAKADKALSAKIYGGKGIDSVKKHHAKELAKWKELAEKAKANGKNPPRKPRGPVRIGDLYKRFVQPMVPYGIRGVLWDQGESMTQLPGVDQFTTMNALITGWRKAWGQGNFWFLHVQKPSGGGPAWNTGNPENRLAVKFSSKLPKNLESNTPAMTYPLQHIKLTKIKNAPLVTAVDLAPGIHPQNKSGYGHRAVRVALGAVYGRDVAISGPVYRSHKIDGAFVTITFDHVGKGLAFKHVEKIQGFEIAGADGKWSWADATIDGDTVVVSSEAVEHPTHARYAFSRRSSFANLYNRDGLPALMFTTASQN
jgi:sialate O-acetylesterase